MDSVADFCSITGSDTNIATYYLEMTDYNLDNAIRLYFDTDQHPNDDSYIPDDVYDDTLENDTNVHSESHESPHSSLSPVQDQNAPVASSIRRILSDDDYNGSGIHPYFEEDFTDYENGNNNDIDALFISKNSLFRYRNIEEALQQAKSSKLPLLVNIFNINDLALTNKNKYIFESQGIVTLLSNSFIFYQCSSESEEGVTVVSTYSLNVFPCLIIIEPSTGEVQALYTKKMNEDNVTMFLLDYLDNALSAPSLPSLEFKAAPLPSNLHAFLNESSQTDHLSQQEKEPKEIDIDLTKDDESESIDSQNNTSHTNNQTNTYSDESKKTNVNTVFHSFTSLNNHVSPVSILAPYDSNNSDMSSTPTDSNEIVQRPELPQWTTPIPKDIQIRFKIRDTNRQYVITIPNTISIHELYGYLWNTYYNDNNKGFVLIINKEKLDINDTTLLKDTPYKNVVIFVETLEM